MRMLRVSFWTQTTGISAIEFALCAPIFIMLLLAGTDALRYTLATDQVEVVASTVGELIAENDSSTVNYMDLQFHHDSAMLTFPRLLSDSFAQNQAWGTTISISMASVDFGPKQSGCGSGCVYTPKMAWAGGNNPRSCLVPMTPADDSSAPSPTTLPAHIYGPGSSIVVDVAYTFKPLFQSVFFVGLTIRRSYYVAPRFVTLLKYQTISGDNGIAKACSGYT